jgi:hypothetical protein
MLRAVMSRKDKKAVAEKFHGRLPYIEQLDEAGWRKTFTGKTTLHPAVPHMGKVRYTDLPP